jgi:DNA-binding MarR family transcriptional regulator
VITTATADQLLTALRRIVRASRTAQQLGLEEDLPGWTVSVLSLLARDGQQRLGKVASYLGVDPSVVSRHVAALEQAGLVSRRPDPADGRAQLLVVTRAGHAALEDHCAMRARWLVRALMDWEDTEAAELAARLERLMRDMQRAPAEPCRPSLGAVPTS